MSTQPLSQLAVIIPAFNPEHSLLDLLAELRAEGFSLIVVVDDGSESPSDSVFEAIRNMEGVVLLTHAVNSGKGRALKTAFNWCLCNHPELKGVVTADADGQHAAVDVARIGKYLVETDAFILGARSFSADVPLRSRIGNLGTRWLMNFLLGRKIQDTQTGLRAIPLHKLSRLISLSGERYEYETNVLVEMSSLKVDMRQLPIQTIYIDGNRASHFNPLLDSMRIYFVLARYCASSLLTAAIDFLVFAIALSFGNEPFIALAVARLCALSFNFLTNRHFVFKVEGANAHTLARFCCLVIGMFCLSYLSIREIVAHTSISPLGAKVIAESLLFLLSFSVQRVFVFSDFKKE